MASSIDIKQNALYNTLNFCYCRLVGCIYIILKSLIARGSFLCPKSCEICPYFQFLSFQRGNVRVRGENGNTGLFQGWEKSCSFVL